MRRRTRTFITTFIIVILVMFDQSCDGSRRYTIRQYGRLTFAVYVRALARPNGLKSCSTFDHSVRSRAATNTRWSIAGCEPIFGPKHIIVVECKRPRVYRQHLVRGLFMYNNMCSKYDTIHSFTQHRILRAATRSTHLSRTIDFIMNMLRHQQHCTDGTDSVHILRVSTTNILYLYVCASMRYICGRSPPETVRKPFNRTSHSSI